MHHLKTLLFIEKFYFKRLRPRKNKLGMEIAKN